MARTYRLSSGRRLVNAVIRPLARRGLAGPHTYVLTVPGRRTGRLYSTPVTLVEDGAGRWLVAPYGDVGWVLNARPAGMVTLSRAGRSEQVSLTELGSAEAAPILKRYVADVAVTRPFFDARPADPVGAFETEARSHPVFRLGVQSFQNAPAA